MIFWLFQWGWRTHCDILHGADVKTQEVHAQSGWLVLFFTSGKFWFLRGIPSILASMFFFISQFLKKGNQNFPLNWNINLKFISTYLFINMCFPLQTWCGFSRTVSWCRSCLQDCPAPTGPSYRPPCSSSPSAPPWRLSPQSCEISKY